MGRKELIELVIQERISRYFEKRTEDGNEEVRRNDELLKNLRDKAPELAEEFQRYMDWLALHSGNHQEGLYLLGVRDGIRLMWEVINVV